MKSENNRELIINPTSAVIALLIVLILRLTLQSPVCCGSADASALESPPLLEPPQSPDPIRLMRHHRAPIQNAIHVIASPVKPTAGGIQPETDAAGTVDAKMIASPASDPAKVAPVAVASPQAATGTESIKTEAAVQSGAVSRSNFVKLALSGEMLDDDAVTWECVEDRSHRLTWEVKKDDGGIRDRDHLYSWYKQINRAQNGVYKGGRCKGGVSCDTAAYARAMNAQRLCGYSDWRLPTRAELETLIQYSSNTGQATINNTYFPHAAPSWYWSASEHSRREDYAWYVLFRNGIALNDLKERPKHVRLVRGDVLH